MRNKWVLILLFSLLFIAAGCWDRVEINERAFTFIVGFEEFKNVEESGEESGEESKNLGFSINQKKDNKLNLFFVIPIPQTPNNGSGGTGGGVTEAKKGFTVVNAQGTTVREIINNLNVTFQERELYLNENRIILFGENIIRNRELFLEVTDFIVREAGISRQANIFVLKGNMAAIEDIQPRLTIQIVPYFLGFITHAINRNRAFDFDINELTRSLRETGGTVAIPVIVIENNEIVWESMALIKEYKLQTYIDKKYLVPYTAITGKLQRDTVLVQYKGADISYSTTQVIRKIYLDKDSEKLKYTVDIRMEGDMTSYEFNRELLDDKQITEMKNKFEKEFSSELEKTAAYFQKKIKHDYFNFEEYTRKNHPKVYKRFKDDWHKAFSEADITFDVTMFIRRIGTSN